MKTILLFCSPPVRDDELVIAELAEIIKKDLHRLSAQDSKRYGNYQRPEDM